MHTNLAGLHKSVSPRLLVFGHGSTVWVTNIVTWDLIRHKQKSVETPPQEKNPPYLPSCKKSRTSQSLLLPYQLVYSAFFWFLMLEDFAFLYCCLPWSGQTFKSEAATVVAELGSWLPNQVSWSEALSGQGPPHAKQVCMAGRNLLILVLSKTSNCSISHVIFCLQLLIVGFFLLIMF